MALFQREEHVKTMNTICFCFSLASFLQLTAAQSVQGEETIEKENNNNKKKKRKKEGSSNCSAFPLPAVAAASVQPAGSELQLPAGHHLHPSSRENRWGWGNSRGQGGGRGGATTPTNTMQNVCCEAPFPARSSGLLCLSSRALLDPTAMVLW